MAARVDITHDQGATFQRQYTWKSGGSAVDLSGYAARMHLRPSVDSTTLTLELTTENGRISLGGSAGTIDLLIDATDIDSTAIDAATYRYDLELVSSSGVVTRLIEGKFKLNPEVTR